MLRTLEEHARVDLTGEMMGSGGLQEHKKPREGHSFGVYLSMLPMASSKQTSPITSVLSRARGQSGGRGPDVLLPFVVTSADVHEIWRSLNILFMLTSQQNRTQGQTISSRVTGQSGTT